MKIVSLRCCGSRFTVVLVTSPRWFIDQVVPEQYEQIAGLIEKTAKDEDAQYLMLSSDKSPIFGDPAIYMDWSHLNGDGAKVFSEIVADKINGMYFQ